ncbi:Dynein heavy chain 1, axonemal [Amphibalanus amphitrite]|uniref:Dynein heavy chain 1, axonemal n=1 Tax=Amphibalanus amphitrite TaxID=1232801 RepID=A0A6A4V371_AMPAM|nr:Dynein heavy chain 1, axonemal [Amphibalanus amphitrite]
MEHSYFSALVTDTNAKKEGQDDLYSKTGAFQHLQKRWESKVETRGALAETFRCKDDNVHPNQDLNEQESDLFLGEYVTDDTIKYFPESSFRPKLQMAYQVPPGSCPRRVAVERRRRQFLSQDIGQLLQEAGVDTDLLTPDLNSPTDPCAERPPPPRILPTVTPLEEVMAGMLADGGVEEEEDMYISDEEEEEEEEYYSGEELPEFGSDEEDESNVGSVKRQSILEEFLGLRRMQALDLEPDANARTARTLPLHWFDDTSFDDRLPEEWLTIAVENGFQHPVPVMAFLPKEKQSRRLSMVVDPLSKALTARHIIFTLSSGPHVWTPAAVIGYHPARALYMLRRIDVREYFLLPRIYVMFCAEDPARFCERVQAAVRLRQIMQDLLRYHLYVDCMPTSFLGQLNIEQVTRIMGFLRSTPGKPLKVQDCNERILKLQDELQLDFLRYQNRLILDTALHRDQKLREIVKLRPPPQDNPLQGQRAFDRNGVYHIDFAETFRIVKVLSILTQKEAIFAMQNVNMECLKVREMQMFVLKVAKPLKIDDFETIQMNLHEQVLTHLQTLWLARFRDHLHNNLRDVGKGWFDLFVAKWEIFCMSKLCKILALIRVMMQDSLRYLARDSCAALVDTMDSTCGKFLSCEKNFEWGEDLVQHPMIGPAQPFFYVELQIDSNGPLYSTPMERFVKVMLNVFEHGVTVTHDVPPLEPLVLDNIFWPDRTPLSSIGLMNPEITVLRDRLKKTMEMIAIPMKAYAKAYTKYEWIYNLDIPKYLAEKYDEEATAQTFQDDVAVLRDDYDEAERALPSHVVIGPFYVNTDLLRSAILKKKQALIDATLDHLAQILLMQAEEVNRAYMKMASRMTTKCSKIEDVTELREFMDTVPELVRAEKDNTIKFIKDYDVLDFFYHPLSNSDFGAKGDMSIWPYKIEVLLEETTDRLIEEEDKFKERQLQDQGTLNDKIDNLTMLVAGMTAFNDITKAHEVANEVRRVWKQLNECKEQGQLLNQRQRLFGMDLTPYDNLAKLIKDCEPYRALWLTASDWLRWQEAWMNDPLQGVDAESIERNVTEAFKTMHKAIKNFEEMPAIMKVAEEIRDEIEAFKPHIPLIMGLRNPGMRHRHWEKLSDLIGIKIVPKATLTFAKCLEMGLQNYTDQIAEVGEIAGKEYSIEQALDKMESEWRAMALEFLPYKDTGLSILKFSDEAYQLLDDHVVMTQSMVFSPFKAPFEERIAQWEKKLMLVQDVFDEWVACQRAWLYLEPIFSSDDISRQLPVESKRYNTMEKTWKKIMKKALENQQVMELCPDQRLLDNLRDCNNLLEQVQKGLSEYLETKRMAFPRFFFLSDEELLEILSQTKNPKAVQPHLKKCFESISRLTFEEDLQITAMCSADGETVPFHEPMYPRGNVEDWLLMVESTMRASLRAQLAQALEAYSEPQRPEWVLNWAGQLVIAGCQSVWSANTDRAIAAGALKDGYELQLEQLDDLRNLIRTDLTALQRNILSALIVIEVHARDVVQEMVADGVTDVNSFSWIGQLRYYWIEEDLRLKHVNAEFGYGFEYLGNTGRLVITPLTDRCYLTLTGALHLQFGGAPAGPAGTGKTETTKDLGKAMAVQCVVFNCSDQLDFMAMGKFFKGLAAAGAWACFDEFNRIDIEVLSVVAQQISCIQKALVAKMDRFLFEGVELQLKPTCSVFITMNPGYAGRTELPDNLSALFRPVAMMVPNYTLIAEISLFSFGFSNARALANKITSTFKLSSEQLSTQDHYDFGMRAVKTVIAAAGNLKRQNPTMGEELIVLRALKDVNVPKFLQEDLKLFTGIISDLFPRVQEEEIKYDELEASLLRECKRKNLQPVPTFIGKCIQLFETTMVRHGLMLVGPTGSGKTRCYQVLQGAISRIKGKTGPDGLPFTPVLVDVLNPKSITMGQLYGEFDEMTHEWTDGILSTLIRVGCAAESLDKKWYMFDGPVDAVWIENMNTVLDDNKKLCLSSGEIIKLDATQTMMFEVGDLAQASPATVSRCGMVYLEPSGLGLNALVESWLSTLPDSMKPYWDTLRALCDSWLEPAIAHMRANTKEIVTTVDSNLCATLLRLMSANCAVLTKRHYSVERLQKVPPLVTPWFMFSLVWSVCGSCDNAGRRVMDRWVRDKMAEEGQELLFPEEGLVYDYRLVDGGIFNTDVEESAIEPPRWQNWLADGIQLSLTPATQFTDILIPTMDIVRNAHLIGMYLTNSMPVLCVGNTGTSKTATVSEKLMTSMPANFLSEFITFSARTSANQTQDLIDSKLDRRRKGQFGPPAGKNLVFFIDDLNMPALETYGAQPPLELLRQWADFGGWYDRKQIGDFRTLVEDESKCHIYGSILNVWLTQLPKLDGCGADIVASSVDMYAQLTAQLLPTPAKSHYTFNLRDLSKVFQGIWMAAANKIEDLPTMLRLWYHETCRVFQDRLVCDEDRDWLDQLIRGEIQERFKLKPDEVLNHDPILFGDLMYPNSEKKPYSEVTDHVQLRKVLKDYIDDYNQISSTPLDIVFFMDAIKHLFRISRVLRQPRGNVLLLGMGGSGRQSLTRFSAHIADCNCMSIELTKTYAVPDWKNDLKEILKKAGMLDQQTVFLFSDTQIKSEIFMEDINSLLNSGDVPNLFASDEVEEIFQSVRGLVQEQGLPPTTANLYAAFIRRVRSNLRVVVTMSPIGEAFRSRLRQFPALVNCCTIDWFADWPPEALDAVARHHLDDVTAMPNDNALREGVVAMFSAIHTDVADASQRFLQELSRHNYVTPKSFLTLLTCFASLLGRQQEALTQGKNRLRTGLDKLLQTGKDVAVMQVELEAMQPELEHAAVVAEETMRKIEVDTKVAEETRTVVMKKEQEAQKQKDESSAIAADAQKDLDEAMPALEAALASLKSLNKNDVVEVRAMQRPPEGVKLVMEAVCILKFIKPKRVAGDMPGQKFDDYWEPGKSLLQDPARFLSSLFEYDKEHIPDDVINKLTPYIQNDAFMPQAVSKVSKACTSLCMWCRAMYKFHFVNKAVAPKRAALAEAQASLAATEAVLKEAKGQLKTVEDGLAQLNAELAACVAHKKELEDKSEQCQQRLVRADKLIGGLADEKDRWAETVATFDGLLDAVVGDILLASGVVAYLGPFTGEFRQDLMTRWERKLTELGVNHSPSASLQSTLGDQIVIRNWQLAGLPKDAVSTDNALIMKFSDRWPLFIDPQGQANKWAKSMELENGLEVTRLSEKDYLRTMENSIRFGKPCMLENVGEELDPALDPILMKQLVKQAGSWVIKLGDSMVPYHHDFKLYITTKIPNPHYSPEVCTKVNIINFTLVESGLQDQLLGVVVAEERPDLEDSRNNLITSNAAMKQELKELEDKILYKLSSSEGSPVDDIELIETLDVSKAKSTEIKAKVEVAEQTEKDINVTRALYIPVSIRARILFFCVSSLSQIDPMYQYSLEWFLMTFHNSMQTADQSDSVPTRVENINEFFTYSLYQNICRSLFERHKLLFAFLMAIRIMTEQGAINVEEYRYLLAGGTPTGEIKENPATDWLPERCWREILAAGDHLSVFKDLPADFADYKISRKFKNVFDSIQPHRERLPGKWEELQDFQRLVLLRCLRPDRVTNGMQDFVANHLGARFVEPQTSSLAEIFKDAGPMTPLILVLSAGTDPAAALYKFAEEKGFARKILSISLGQGQGPIAEGLMRQGVEKGRWVFFQNCHLAPSWMPTMERLIENLTPETMHKDFRLWLTSTPSSSFPLSVLQNGMKMTIEPPRGVKANMLKAYMSLISPEMLDSIGDKSKTLRRLLFSLSLFNAVCLERRKFGPLGFNIPYAFTDGDLRICISQLQMFLEEYEDIPFPVLRYTAGHINYGGRVTDDQDRRCILTILADYYRSEVLATEHEFDASGVYHQVDADVAHDEYLAYIRSLPINDSPELFGLHANADITFAQNETFTCLNTLLQLQPRSGGQQGASADDVSEQAARQILGKLVEPFDIPSISAKYPVMYSESMNTVLVQEAIRYNGLLSVIKTSLNELLRALKGLVVMSQGLERMATSLFNSKVPEMWAGKAYPSLKPLGAWVEDLILRTQFIRGWIEDGMPPVYWISGFFFPQAFLTGTLQNFARRHVVSIDTVGFGFSVLSSEPTSAPEDGCYVRGLFLEGAGWDAAAGALGESRPRELYTQLPVMWLLPVENRQPPDGGFYLCPVYKTLTRAGTLSTTGHSTNYVLSVELPSEQPQSHWIKRGVALICALDF